MPPHNLLPIFFVDFMSSLYMPVNLAMVKNSTHCLLISPFYGFSSSSLAHDINCHLCDDNFHSCVFRADFSELTVYVKAFQILEDSHTTRPNQPYPIQSAKSSPESRFHQLFLSCHLWTCFSFGHLLGMLAGLSMSGGNSLIPCCPIGAAADFSSWCDILTSFATVSLVP